MHTYFLTHSILRWKRVLVYLIPGLQPALALIERLYRYNCLRTFEILDTLHKWPHKYKYEAIFTVILIYDEIKCLIDTESYDHSVLDHLKEILHDRLKVLCSRAFNFDESKKVNWSKEFVSLLVALMACHEPEFVSYIPSRYIYPKYLELSVPIAIPVSPPAKPLDLSACLLRRFDCSKYCNDNAEITDCCCGWTFDSIPTGLLSFCGYSGKSFAGYIHSGLRETETDESLDPLQGLQTVFRGSWKEKDLRKRMFVFGGAVVYWLKVIFISLTQLLSVLNSPEGWKCLEDQVDRVNKEIRRQLLDCILRKAIIMYHEFCNSYKSQREGEVDAESTNELCFPESANVRCQTTNWIHLHLLEWASQRGKSEARTHEFNLVTELFGRLLRIQMKYLTFNDDGTFSSEKSYIDK